MKRLEQSIIHVRQPAALAMPEVQALLLRGCERHWMDGVELCQWLARECHRKDIGFFLARSGFDYQGFAVVEGPGMLFPFPNLLFFHIAPRHAQLRDQLFADLIAWCGKQGWRQLLTNHYSTRNIRGLTRLSSRIAPTRLVGYVFAFQTQQEAEPCRIEKMTDVSDFNDQPQAMPEAI